MNTLKTVLAGREKHLPGIMKQRVLIVPAFLLILFSLLFIAFVPHASAVEDLPNPESSFYVLDQAGVLSADTSSLILSTSKELERLTKAQVVVVTLKTLGDQPLEDVSLGILRKWGIGDKKLNNGLLILLVPSEHQSRIEVGYGLEGALPDAKTGRIQDEYMLPSYQAGNYDQGLRNGYLQCVKAVAAEYNVTINIPETTQTGSDSNSDQQNKTQQLPAWAVVLIAIGAVILFWIDHRFFGGFIFGMLLSMLFRGGGSGRGGGGFGGGGGMSGGGGSGGGGGSSRGW